MERNKQIFCGSSFYFVGIGGAGMYPLARLAHGLGYEVSGCDRLENENVRRLRALGIDVARDGEECHAPRGATVVYTLAAPEDHPVLREARSAGRQTLTRTELLGCLSRRFAQCATVAGTHGKSSTVGFCASILKTAGLSPTVLCGADLTREDGGFLSGRGDVLLLEACEYRRAFLSLAPTHALALGADYEHPDCYKNEEEVKAAFDAYLSLPTVRVRVAPVGFCEDGVSFGEGGSFSLRRLREWEGRASFDLFHAEKNLGRVQLSVLGAFQAQNALAAAALCHSLGVEDEAILLGLSAFRGIGGRMELCGHVHGAPIYLDYAHHPAELSAALSCAFTMGKRVICLFEGHTYSRAFAFRQEFARILSTPHVCGVLPIYPARETDTLGMSGERMAREASADFVPGYEAAAEYVLKKADKDSLVLLVGAGRIGETLTFLKRNGGFHALKA
ncbi:MAG: hypothetical protein J6W28_01575 [Clostridia bacterium]|nr:hypothetical protein [Clostridia bacterium]